MAHQGICSVEGCGNTLIVAHGYCDKHYRRWRSHGDPTAGRTPEGEPHRYFQDVVLAYDGDDCLFWPFNRNGTGYGQIARLGSGSGKKDLVHRRVCEEVNGPPPTPEHDAAHGCGKGRQGCCAKRHLSWKTPVENHADKIAHGTTNRGEQGTAKLTEADVREIRARIKSGETQRAIARDFNVHFATINHIHVGDTWFWMD